MIERKKCKCGCGLPSSFGYGGWRYDHSPQLIADAKKSRNNKAAERRNKKLRAKVKKLHSPENDEAVLKQIWFTERRKEMTGICSCGCGKPSSKNDDNNFRSSACHILPQRHFASVRWHPLNFIEMAFWGGCHTNMDDQGSDRWDKLACWPEIVRKFKIIYPKTYRLERQFIPKILQQFI